MRRAKYVCLLICVLYVGLPAVANAQAANAQTFEAGVKGGLAVTSMPHAGEVFDQIVGVTTNESTSRLGVTGGGYVRFPINERLGFQPEGLFSMKGVETYQSSSGGSVKVRVSYFEVPLLVRFRFADTGDGFVRYAFAGPSFGIKISDGAHADLNSATKDLQIDTPPTFKSLDLGFVVGGGVEFGRYLLEGRFTAGLTDVADTTYPHRDSLRNHMFSFMFGMKLR